MLLTCLLIWIHEFGKILTIHVNDSSDSNHSSIFTVLVVASFTKKEERQRKREQAKYTHHPLLSIVVFVSESYIFHDSCKLISIES